MSTLTHSTTRLTDAVRRSRRFIASIAGSAEGAVGLGLCLVVLAVVVVGAFLPFESYTQTDLKSILQPPSAAHPFGTDEAGRDVMMRVLAGAIYTIGASFGVVLLSGVLGCIVGVTGGYVRGWAGNLLLRVTDLFLAYPVLLIAIVIGAVLGQGLPQTVIALSAVVWAGYARIAYVQTVLLREGLFVQAATVMGTSRWRILVAHLLPNAASPLLVKAVIDLALAAEWIAALGFVGLGASAPTPEWGTMIATSRVSALTAWWYVAFPSGALLITILGLMLFGSALEKRVSGRGSLSRRTLRELRA